MLLFSKLIVLFTILTLSFAHEPNGEKTLDNAFRQKIHSMCAGHHHLNHAELEQITNLFAENFQVILTLQENLPNIRPERYLCELTGLVSLSNTLSKDQKYLFYRRSYDRAIEARKVDEEWKDVLGVLVERTNALSLDELNELMITTQHEPLKPLITKAISRKKIIEEKEKLKEKRLSKKSLVKNPDPLVENKAWEFQVSWLWVGLFLFAIVSSTIFFWKKSELN
ncbi:MAG: hypothetical protein ABF337_09975 [Akkermansiaceae bacterium]